MESAFGGPIAWRGSSLEAKSHRKSCRASGHRQRACRKTLPNRLLTLVISPESALRTLGFIIALAEKERWG